LLHEKSSNKRAFSAAEKIKRHGSDRAEGFQRTIADFVCFHCPLVASAEAKPLRHTQKKYESIVSTIAQKGQSKSCLKLFLPFAEKSEKIAP